MRENMSKSISKYKGNVIGRIWPRIYSIMASIMVIFTMYQKFFPNLLGTYFQKYTNKFTDFMFHTYIGRHAHKFTNLMNPYIQITFPELSGHGWFKLKRNETYTTILSYLSTKSSQNSNMLKAEVVNNNKDNDQNSVVLSMNDNEEIVDEYKGVKLWWGAEEYTNPKTSKDDSYPFEKRYLTLTFHKRHRDVVTKEYITHVLKEGKAIAMKNRQLRLYTNNPSKDWGYSSKKDKWSHTTFEHPASFETLAMEPEKKQEIINDLVKFKNGKDYYAKVGKAWKRGYLLYGPPGTGKSTMIAAMANFMNYDIYDLELTAVEENTELRRLLIETTNKSIIVIEDIDCSLDLTGKRKMKDKDFDSSTDDDDDDEEYFARKKSYSIKEVTLSGLLNFIDGIWSACGGERIIIFTTNYVDKLDPALIRSGRMDKHIEMSYCCFEGFKVLAKNYLDIESHDLLFPIIEKLLRETNISPADVAENLMPKSITEDSETCLKNLIQSLETRKKAEDEKAMKEFEEAQLKAEKDKNKLDQKEDQEVKANENCGKKVKKSCSKSKRKV